MLAASSFNYLLLTSNSLLESARHSTAKLPHHATMETIKANISATPLSTTIIVLTIGAMILAGLSTLLVAKKDPQEPPFLSHSILLIGHLIPMFREGANYYTRLWNQHRQGIYTIPVLRGRMYMISSPDWALAFHKAHKTLSFHDLVAPALEKVFCFDDPTMEIIKENMNDERGDRSGVLLETHDMIIKTMAPGKHLDELNHRFLEELTPHFKGLVTDGKIEKLHLWDWVRHHFTLASCAAIYGPEDPFSLSPALEPDFWEIDYNVMKFIITPYPSIFARKANMARQRVLDSLVEYAENECWKQASQLAKNRADMNLGRGISKRQHGVGELSFLFALLTNTVPSAFWFLSYVFVDPELLADVRAEVDQCVRVGEGKKRIINATKLKTQCPLFFCAMRETLRIAGVMNINRYVREDTMLTNHSTDEAYLLRKGSMVQVASTVIHFLSEVFGEDAMEFRPRRFMSTTEKTLDPAAAFRDGTGKVHGGSFRTFGGGTLTISSYPPVFRWLIH